MLGLVLANFHWNEPRFVLGPCVKCFVNCFHILLFFSFPTFIEFSANRPIGDWRLYFPQDNQSEYTISNPSYCDWSHVSTTMCHRYKSSSQKNIFKYSNDGRMVHFGICSASFVSFSFYHIRSGFIGVADVAFCEFYQNCICIAPISHAYDRTGI